MDARYRRGAPGVRDAFSKALGAKNRPLVYRREIRCEKQASPVRDTSSKALNSLLLHRTPLQRRETADSANCEQLPPVRDAFSEALGVKNRLLLYGREIRCKKQASPVPDASSKARNCFLLHRTHLQKREQPTPQTMNSFLRYATHLRRYQKQPPPVRAPTHKQLDHIPVRHRI